jgi:hypothetical protein
MFLLNKRRYFLYLVFDNYEYVAFLKPILDILFYEDL